MKQIVKSVLLLWFMCITTFSYTQTVKGHWFGIGMVQTTSEYDSYLSELIIRQKGKLVWGEFDYYFKDSLVKVPINGNFDEQTRRLSIKPFPVIYFRSLNAKNSIDCFMSGNFNLLTSKTESVLHGSLMSDADHQYTVPAINFRLTRSDDTGFAVIKKEAEEMIDTILKATPSAMIPFTVPDEKFSSRKNMFTKEIEVAGNTVRLELYDNGEIDYDSVSLYLNNKKILPKSMLTHKAIKLSIDLDLTLEYNELSMFAENLGFIPPNTAALILYDGKIRYEAIMTSDLKKNATIRIRRKK